MSNEWFNYEELTTRNIGFVSEKEQKILKDSTVFIAGVGGMGGAALMCLVRAGIENFIISDFDEFDVSNLNRQLFADYDSLNVNKTVATIEKLKKINPNVNVETYDQSWPKKLDEILPKVDVALNGCDDVKASIQLMRAAKKHNKVVVDAFAALFPNVYVVKPSSPRPESFLNFPTKNKNIEDFTDEDIAESFQNELLYVLTNTSSIKYCDLPTASEMVTGKRSRISFSHMVISTGCFMSYELIKILLDKKKYLASHKGVFVNPWTYKIEKPLIKPLFLIKRFFVKLFIKRLSQ